MLIRIILGVSIFAGGLLFAQPKDEDRTIPEVAKSGSDSKHKSASEKAIAENIKIMETSIKEKVAGLEKLQTEAAEFNVNLQEKMLLVNEKGNVPLPGHQKYIVSRHVEYIFEGGNKIKEVRVVSMHKSLTDDINSVIKVVSFSPANLDTITVTVNKLDTRVKGAPEILNYKNFAPEVKLVALKTIDATLQSAIYRLDTFIQRSQVTKNEKNKNILEGL